MKKNYKLILGLTLLFLVQSIIGKSQDIHYAQYFNAPMNINPALTGMFRGDTRIAANYRNQWNNANASYTTFTGAVDMKVPRIRIGNGYFAGGALINYDRAGDSKLSYTQLVLGSSYSQQLAERHFVSLGAQVSFGNRKFDLSDLKFEDEAPGTPTAEKFANTSYNVFNVNGGLNYHYQNPTKRTKADLGIGIFNITQPSYGFDQNLQDKYVRMVYHALIQFQVMDKLDLIINGVFQNEGPHQELIYGLSVRHYLNMKKTKELSLELGGYYRTKDAIYPHFQINWKNVSLGLSYDINISEFRESSQGRGGPEIYFKYLISKVKPKDLKICPIY